MAKVRLKYNPTGMWEVRRLPGVIGRLEAEGRKRLDAANSSLEEGEGYLMSSGQGRPGPPPKGSKGKGFQGRWAVRIYTATNHAKRSNAIHNTLVRLLGP